MALLTSKELPLDLKVPLMAQNSSHRLVELSNGIVCFLISNPNDNYNFCSVSVNSGSKNDPPNIPGLAHLVEHMLFAGTKEFPSPSDFYSKIASANGSTNAFTTYDETNFHFEVPTGPSSSNSLDIILSNFASFFKCPLFNTGSLKREIDLVHEEHMANIESNDKLFYYGAKLLSNKHSMFHQFSTGNYETLHDWPRQQKLKLKHYLRNYFDNYYTCSNLKIVFRGPQSLNFLQKLISFQFSTISNQRITSTLRSKIFAPSDLGKIVWVKRPNTKLLRLLFPINTINKETIYFIRLWIELLGNEASNSICDILSKMGACNNVVVFEQRVDRYNSIVIFEATLSSKGMNQIHTIISAIFDYIQMVQKLPPSQILDFVNDFSKLEKVNSYYKETESANLDEIIQQAQFLNYASNYQGIILGYDPYETTSFSVDYFNKFTTRYFSRQNLGCVVLSERMDVSNISSFDTEDLFDRFYKFSYKVLRMDKLRDLTPNTSNCTVPKRNSFLEGLCEDSNCFKKEQTPRYTVRTSQLGSNAPTLLETTPRTEAWVLKDFNCFTRAHCSFQIHIPIEMSPSTYITIDLLCDLLGEFLLKEFYDCEVVGYSWGIWPTINNTSTMCFTLSGLAIRFAEALVIFITLIKSFLRDLQKVTYSSLTRSRVRVRKFYEKLLGVDQFQKFMASIYWLIEKDTYSIKERFEALEEVTINHLNSIGTYFNMGASQSTILIHGDITLEQANSLCKQVESAFITPSQSRVSHLQPLITFRIPRGLHLLTLEDVSDVSQCLVYIELGSRENSFIRAMSRVLDFVVQTRVVPELRIKKKLAYHVLCGQRSMRKTIGYFIYLSSSNNEPIDLLLGVESCLNSICQKIYQMSDNKFKNFLGPIIDSTRNPKPPANLVFEAEPMKSSTNFNSESVSFQHHKEIWEKIMNKTYRFTENDGHESLETNLLKSLSKPQISNFFATKIDPTSNNRAAIIVVSKNASNSNCLEENLLKSTIRKYKENRKAQKSRHSLGVPHIISDVQLFQQHSLQYSATLEEK